jgi:Tol biopolymer transport system component
MTSNDAFLRDLELWLDDDAGTGAPDYVNEVLEGVNKTSQQPAWSSLEWWLPIDIGSIGGRARVQRLAWITVVVALLVAIVVAVASIGAPRKLPPPFGPAGNGLIAIPEELQIDLFAPDGSNRGRLVGADGIEAMTWSPDGSKLAFRTLSPATSRDTVIVVNADGSHLVDATRGWPKAVRDDEPIAWAPDSRHLVSPSPNRLTTLLLIASADGSSARPILDDASSPGLDRYDVAWSPDRDWISFVGRDLVSGEVGLYAVHPDGTSEHRIGDVTSEMGLGVPAWAPDPARSSLVVVDPSGGLSIVDASIGQAARLGAANGMWPAWSPDGRSIAWWDHGIRVGTIEQLLQGAQGRRLVAGPIDCGDPRPADPATPCGPPVWSPDGTKLFAPGGPGTTVVAISIDGSTPPLVIPHPSAQLDPRSAIAWQRAP